MKRYFLIVLCILLLCVVGCSKNNQIICSKTITEDGETVLEERTFYLDKNSKVETASETFTFSSKEDAKDYCDMFNDVFGSNYSDLIICSDKEITINNYEKLIDGEDSSIRIVGLTKEELINLGDSSGYTCKE